MPTEYVRLRLFYLGVNQSESSYPSFYSGTFLQNIEFEVKDGTQIPSSSTLIGTTNSNGTITLNSTGTALNSVVPFNENAILSCSSSRTVAINNWIANYSKPIFDLAAYLGYPTNRSNRYWFAAANDTMYAPFFVEYYVSSSGSINNMYGWRSSGGDTAIPIRLISDDSIVPNTWGIRVIPTMTTSMNNGSYYYTLYNNIFKVADEYYRARFSSFYLGTNSSDRESRFSRNMVLTENEVAFITNSTYIPDPYINGETSTVSVGMTGTFDASSDTIIAPAVPTLTTADAGFVRIYNPNLSQLKSLAQYMWTDPNFLTTLLNHAKQLLENPIESIISLNLLPCAIPNSADEEVKVLFISTGVHMPPATTQFVEVDCGSLEVKEYYGSALDYSPYTKIHCYLPYIGQVTLDTDEVMNSTISIKYRIDIVTGMCVAMISVNGSILYQFSGHCSIAMPLTSADFSTYVSAAIGTAKAVAGIAAAGAGAGGVAAQLLGTAAPRTTTTSFDSTDTTRNPNSGRQVKSGTHHEEKTVSSKGSSFGEMATAAAVNTVSSVMGSKTVVEHSGGFTGNSGYLAVRRPYLIMEIPRMCNPVDYGKFNGYPSMITSKLSECEGFTKVQNIQLTGFPATNEEMSEIAEMLMGGVIF